MHVPSPHTHDGDCPNKESPAPANDQAPPKFQSKPPGSEELTPTDASKPSDSSTPSKPPTSQGSTNLVSSSRGFSGSESSESRPGSCTVPTSTVPGRHFDPKFSLLPGCSPTATTTTTSCKSGDVSETPGPGRSSTSPCEPLAAPAWFMTKTGTSNARFQEFVQKLDNNTGGQVAYDNVDFQLYVSTFTEEQLEYIKSQPFVLAADWSNGTESTICASHRLLTPFSIPTIREH